MVKLKRFEISKNNVWTIESKLCLLNMNNPDGSCIHNEINSAKQVIL